MFPKLRRTCLALVAAAICSLAGTGSVLAQAPDNPLVGISHDNYSTLWAVARNGDAYASVNGYNWTFRGNAFGAPGLSVAAGIAVVDGNAAFVVATDGRVVAHSGTSWTDRENVFTGMAQGTVTSVSWSNGALWAGTSNGEVRASNNGTQWTSRPSMFGSVVQAGTTSWGALKATGTERP